MRPSAACRSAEAAVFIGGLEREARRNLKPFGTRLPAASSARADTPRTVTSVGSKRAAASTGYKSGGGYRAAVAARAVVAAEQRWLQERRWLQSSGGCSKRRRGLQCRGTATWHCHVALRHCRVALTFRLACRKLFRSQAHG